MFLHINWISITAILFLINLAGLITVSVDKHKARKRRWRIPERTFFLLSLIGASPGVFLGLLLFRHKTRHWNFMLGIPAIFFLQLAVLYFLLVR